MNYPERIAKALKEQGRTKKWLTEKLGFTYKTLFVKLKDDSFSISETYFINSILGLGEGLD